MNIRASSTNSDSRISDSLQWLRSLGTTVSRKLEMADLRAYNVGRGIGKGAILKSIVPVFA